MVRLGILGGTFDPVHSGHVAMARAAAAAARLDRVLMVPCARPPHKERPDLTDPFHRFAMIALVVAEDPILAVSSIELRRGGVSYTAETLREMHRAEQRSELHLIMGSDSFAEMASWKEPEEILSRAAVIVVPRLGAEPESIQGRLAPSLARALKDPGTPWPDPLSGRLPFASILGVRPVDVSSTDIRTRVREGRSIDGMVPAPVEAFIRRQGLYGPSPIG